MAKGIGHSEKGREEEKKRKCAEQEKTNKQKLRLYDSRDRVHTY